MSDAVIREERERAMQAAAVTVTWQCRFYAAGTRDGGQLGYTEKTLGALTNDAGYWRVCGVPRETPPSVHVVTDSGSDLRRGRLEGTSEVDAGDQELHQFGLPTDTGRETRAARCQE